MDIMCIISSPWYYHIHIIKQKYHSEIIKQPSVNDIHIIQQQYHSETIKRSSVNDMFAGCKAVLQEGA
jgi:hypothetical protein